MSTTDVYTGRWTDWDKGYILGDQVTLSSSSSNKLVAFIAIFITIVGGASWSILAYYLHQSRVVRGQKNNGFHYQIQALLRNNLSPLRFLFQIFEVVYVWRNHISKVKLVKETVYLTVVALIIYTSFFAAGLLLSLIATSGKVLLGHPSCGSYNYTMIPQTDDTQAEFFRALSAYASQEVKQAYNYAEICYPSTTRLHGATIQSAKEPAASCHFFPKAYVGWQISRDIDCPFFQGICRGSRSNAVQFNTGYLDTNDDLGINADKTDRLLFRRVTTCAPIETNGFIQTVNDIRQGNATVYNYGSSQIQPNAPADFNGTFYYSHNSLVAADQAYRLLQASTSIMCTSEASSTYQPCFIPDPRLAAANSSMTLLFLANRAMYVTIECTVDRSRAYDTYLFRENRYSTLVTDPWFNAVSELNDTGYFYNEVPAMVLGCIGQVELCNPTLLTGNCTTWDPYRSTFLAETDPVIGSLQLNRHQEALVSVVSAALYNSDLGSIVGGLADNILVASDYLDSANGIDSLGLESEQWVIELEHMQSISMAMMQRSIFTSIVGPSDPELTQYRMRNQEKSWICQNQKFYDTTYSSFSVIGISLIFGVGGAIIILGAFVTFFVPTFYRKDESCEYAREQWHANGLLQLQRVAFEDRGLGRWHPDLEHVCDSIPITTACETFLSFTEVKVPRLESPDFRIIPVSSRPVSVEENEDVSASTIELSGAEAVTSRVSTDATLETSATTTSR